MFFFFFLFFQTEDFNSSERCQKQTVSYNMEWCFQLRYVECRGDKWYCDTEPLSKSDGLGLRFSKLQNA